MRFISIAFVVSLSLTLPAFAEDHPARKILFFSKSSGYEHQVIKRTD